MRMGTVMRILVSFIREVGRKMASVSGAYQKTVNTDVLKF